MIIEKIKGPADVKKLTLDEMNILAKEVRESILKKLSKRGGHFGPNFGMVEATIAMHYVFNSPKDKIVWDVSHQSYTHKILTGRAEAFIDETKYAKVSGYTDPKESEHDHFIIGHTSTAVSLACGMAKGRDVCGEDHNVIAVVGDGSLSGGEALTGLNVAGEYDRNLIIVANDNQMSIAENHGGMYEKFMQLRESNGTCADNLFRSMNLDYVYESEGNNIERMIAAFQKVKDAKRPIVLHINTTKGNGYAPAMEHKEAFHWSPPFDTVTGQFKEEERESWEDITANQLLKEMKADQRVVALVAGVPTAMGFDPEKRVKAGRQLVDVGIAEETAVAMASGLAKAGGKPVFGTHSTFMQRTYDQISQDLCVNNNPATILVSWASITGMNDVTHTCFYDIPMLSSIPNLVYLAPTNKEEYLAMLHWSIHQTSHPVAIRVPFGPIRISENEVLVDYGMLNKYEMTHKGSQVAILGLGNFYHLGKEVLDLLKQKGVDATLINPRYITGIDTEMMADIQKNHSLVITLEDGQVEGGFGEKIASYLGISTIRCKNYGVRKEFVDRYDYKELMKANGLMPTQIVEDVLNLI